jgi:radical SAM protein with 4Fe4S-binding SPASM domain
MYGVPENEAVKNKNTLTDAFIMTSDKIDNTKELKKNIQSFNINMNFYTESINYNVGLNGKVCIDTFGNVKNYLTHVKNYGNINNESLVNILRNNNFKYKWLITKDNVESCNECQYRYMCNDTDDIIINNNKFVKKILATTTPIKMNGLKIAFPLLVTLLLTSCASDKQNIIIGKWQSLNDRNLSIEFNVSNGKTLIRLAPQSQPDLINDTAFVMGSQFKVINQKRNRLRIIEDARYGDDASIISEIEFINKDRIILYTYKHHGILDFADEFARTSSPHKFDSIMNAIMLTPQ